MSEESEQKLKFETEDDAKAYFSSVYDDGTFSISFVNAEDIDAQAEAYKRHWVCCGYGHDEIVMGGSRYIAIYDYGH